MSKLKLRPKLKLELNLKVKENVRTGIFVLVLLGITLWVYSAFLSGVDNVFIATLSLVPKASFLAKFKGIGILFAIFASYIIGLVFNIGPVRKLLRGAVRHIPLVGKFISQTVDLVAEMVSLPLVEVYYPTKHHRESALLRSVRWAYEPPLEPDGERRKFIECTLIMPTANNPTSGRIVKVEPDMIHCILGNASGEYMGQVLTFTMSNPEWNRVRFFDPNEFLGKELIPDHEPSEVKEIRIKNSDE